MKSIRQAITILGTSTIGNIAVCTSVYEVFGNGKESVAFDLKGFWWHSLKCAVLARRIAEKVNQRDAEEAFLCGLLHDIGRLVLWANFGEQYTLLSEGCGKKQRLCLEAEAELVAGHCEISVWLLRRWNFQSFMVDAVLYHHEPADRIKTALPLVQFVYLASAFSHGPEEETGEADEIAENILGLHGAALAECKYGADEKTKTIAQSLHIEISPRTEGRKRPLQKIRKRVMTCPIKSDSSRFYSEPFRISWKQRIRSRFSKQYIKGCLPTQYPRVKSDESALK